MSKSRGNHRKSTARPNPLADWMNHHSEDDFWVFNLAFGGFSLGMFSFWALYMSNNPSETSDKLLLVISSSLSLFFVLIGILEKNFRNSYFVVSISIISLCVGLAIKENQDMSREHVMGFGLAVLMGSVLVIYLINKYAHMGNRYFRLALIAFSVYLVFIAAISFYQDRDSLIESQHSEYVLNELISTRAGKIPYQDFVPQYTYILTFVSRLLPTSLNFLSVIDVLVLILTVTAFLSLLIALFIGSSLFQEKRAGILWAIAIIVPLTSVTAGWSRTTFVGPPTTLLSGPSIRIFLGMILALALFFFLRPKNADSNNLTITTVIFLGICSGIVALINLDFGIAATLAMFTTCLILNSRSIMTITRTAISFVSGFVALWSLLIFGLDQLGQAPNWDLFGWFIRQFGGGFGSVPISYPGPVMFAFPTIFGLAVFYSLSLYKLQRRVNSELPRNIQRNLAVLTFISIWTFLSTPYYLNRSYHSGQMSTLYLPLAVCITGLLAIALSRGNLKNLINRRSFLPLLIVSASIASVWISPNPKIEINRIMNLNPDGTVPRPEVRELIASSQQIIQEISSQYKSIAYFGEEGNIVELATGITSANIFNNPLDMFQSDNAINLSCKFITDLNPEALILTSNGVAAFAWNDESLCGGKYKRVSKIGIFEIAERTNP